MRIVYTIAGYIFLILCLALQARCLYTQNKEIRDAKRANAELTGQLDAQQKNIAKAAEVRHTGQKFRVEVEHESRKTNWGDTPVPSDVVRRLCATTSCTAAGNEMQPSGNKSRN